MGSLLRLRIVVAGLLGLGWAAVSAFAAPVYTTNAETVTGTVRTHVGDYVAWRDDCTSKPLKIEMLDPPKYGKISQEVGLVTVDRAVTGSLDGCSGKKVEGILLYYQADEGFTGDDVFRFRYRYVEPDDEPVITTFTVTVK